MRKILTILLGVALLAACSSKPAGPTDPGQTMDVGAGEEFRIVLESNPTTGYHWAIVKGSLDESLVQFVSNEYQSTSDPGLVGGGGVEIWTFKALKRGAAKIVLGYFPPSNTPTDPARTETFVIDIK